MYSNEVKGAPQKPDLLLRSYMVGRVLLRPSSPTIQHIYTYQIKKSVQPTGYDASISAYPLRERIVQSLPYGNKPTLLKFTVHRIYCPRCGKEYVERFHFLSHPEARQTTALERTIVELRRDMSIHAISQYYQSPGVRSKTSKSGICKPSSRQFR